MDRFISGEWNAICDRCGFKYKASKLREEPRTHLRVCDKCVDEPNPQEFLKGREDKQSVPWTRPEPQEQNVSVTYIDTSIGTQETTIPSGTFNNEL